VKELQHTIKKLYGSDFNSSKYLSKFFDLKLEIPGISIEKYIESFSLKINEDKSNYFSIAVKQFTLYHNIKSMRDIDRYFTVIKCFEPYILQNHKSRSGVESINLCIILRFVILPYIAGLYSLYTEEYSEFMNGKGEKGFEKLKEFIGSNEQLWDLLSGSLRSKLGYEKINDETIRKEAVFANLEKIYNIIVCEKNEYESFGVSKTDFDCICQFKNEISLLGDLADLESNHI
jgi:hypothetical protein